MSTSGGGVDVVLLSQQVRATAEKLKKRAQDAAVKHGTAASAGMMASVDQLYLAADLLEQQTTRPRSLSSTEMSSIIRHLMQVANMLDKKSSEMKSKQAMGPANALATSASHVRIGMETLEHIHTWIHDQLGDKMSMDMDLIEAIKQIVASNNEQASWMEEKKALEMELETIKERYEKEIHTLNERIQKHASAIESSHVRAEDATKAHETQLEEYESTLASKEKEILTIKEELENIKASALELTMQMTDNENERTELKDQVEALKFQLNTQQEDYEARIAEFMTQLKDCEEKAEEASRAHEDTVANLEVAAQNELRSAKIVHDTATENLLTKQAKEFEATIHELQTKIKSLQQALDAQLDSDDTSAQDIQLAALREENNRLVSSSADIKSTYEGKLKALEEEMISLQSKANAAQLASEQQAAQHSASEANLRLQLDSALAQVADMEKAICNAKDLRSQLDSALAQVAALEDSKEDDTSLADDISAAKATIADLTAEKEAWLKQSDNHEATIASLTVQIDELKASEQEKSSQIENFLLYESNVKATWAKLEEDKSSMTEAYRQLKEAHDSFVAQNNDLKTEIHDVKVANSSLEQKNDSLREQLATLGDEYAKATDQASAAHLEEINLYKEQIHSLTMELKELREHTKNHLVAQLREEFQSKMSSLRSEMDSFGLEFSSWREGVMHKVKERCDAIANDASAIENDKLAVDKAFTLLQEKYEKQKAKIQQLHSQASTTAADWKASKSALAELLNQWQSDFVANCGVLQSQIESSRTSESDSNLASLQLAFDQYKIRAGAALKKAEKRASLLNPMRLEKEALEIEIQALKANQTAYKLQLEEANMMNEDMASRLTSSLSEVNALKALQVQSLALEDSIQAKDAEMKALVQEIAAVSAKAALAEDSVKEKEQLLAKLQEDVLTLKEKADSDATLIKEKDNAIAEAISARDAILEEARSSKHALEAKCSGLRADIAMMDGRIAQLTKELDEANESRDNMVATKVEAALSSKQAAFDATIHSLTAELEGKAAIKLEATLCAERTIWEAKLKDFETQMIAAKTDTENYVAKIQVLESEIVKQQEQITQLENSLAESVPSLEGPLKVLQAQLESVRLEKQSLESELEQKATIERDLNETRAALSESVSHLQAQVAERDAEIMKLTQSLIAKENELNQATILPAFGPPSNQRHATITLPPSSDIDLLRIQVAERDATIISLQETLTEKLNQLAQLKQPKQLTLLEGLQLVIDEEKEAVAQRQAWHEEQMNSLSSKATAWLDEARSLFDRHADIQRRLEAKRSVVLTDMSALPPITADIMEAGLTFKSGVVVKAGANFTLPVVCTVGTIVEWTFRIEEMGGNIDFCLRFSDSNGEQVLQATERFEKLSGTFTVETSGTLTFLWDNGFSWLNEKTLDYHVSILERIDVATQTHRRRVKCHENKLSILNDRLQLLNDEEAIIKALETFRDSGSPILKDLQLCLEECMAHREMVVCPKLEQVQTRMEALKSMISLYVSEQHKLSESSGTLTNLVETIEQEQSDVETTRSLWLNRVETVELVSAQIKMAEAELKALFHSTQAT